MNYSNSVNSLCYVNLVLSHINNSYLKTAISIIDGIYEGKISIKPELVDGFIGKFGGIESIKRLVSESQEISYITSSDLPRYQTIADFIGCFNNTILFRDFKIKSGRNISMINPRIKGRYLEAIRIVHNDVARFINHVLRIESGSLDSYFGGSMKSTNLNPKYALSYALKTPNAHMIKLDISKFYDSVKTSNFLKHDVISCINTVSDSFIKLLDDTDDEFFVVNHDKRLFYNMPPFTKMDGVKTDHLDCTVNIKDIFKTNRMLGIFMLSYLMHNNKIPTGAIYSPALANLYLFRVDLEFAKNIGSNVEREFNVLRVRENPDVENVHYFRFMDDLTIFIPKSMGIKPFDLVKVYERIANKYGLHLKYSKTSIHDLSKSSNIPILGYTYKLSNGVFHRYIESKYRKEILDLIRQGGYDSFDFSKRGKLSYALSAEDSFKDIMLHYNYDKKLSLFNSDKLKFKFREKIYNVKFEGLHIKDIINAVKEPYPGDISRKNIIYTTPYMIRRMNNIKKNMAIRYVLQFMMSSYSNRYCFIRRICADHNDPNNPGLVVYFDYNTSKGNRSKMDCMFIPTSILNKIRIGESELNDDDYLLEESPGSILKVRYWNIDNPSEQPVREEFDA